MDVLRTSPAIRDLVSVNNQGEIAYVEGDGEANGVFLASKQAPSVLVSFAPDGKRDYGRGVTISDHPEPSKRYVAATERSPAGAFLLRKWSSDSQTRQIVGTSYDDLFGPLNDPLGYESFSSFSDVNQDGDVVYVALETDFATVQRLHVRNSFRGETIQIGEFSRFAVLRPAISDTKEVVFRSESGNSIFKTDPGAGSFSRIAGIAEGFSEVGTSPGISNDGRSVAFYGDRGSQGHNGDGSPDGKGIWVSLRAPGNSTARQLIQVAGVSGELGIDAGDPLIVGDETPITIENFASNSRVGVGGVVDTRTGQHSVIHVTFLADDPRPGPGQGKETLWAVRLLVVAENPANGSGGFRVARQDGPIAIARVGDQADGRTITDLEIHDPINDRGQIGFWAEFGDRTGVVLAGWQAPTVVNVATHGFNPNSVDDPDWDGFRANWFAMQQIFDEPQPVGLVHPDSDLANRVQTYVATWDSHAGFRGNFITLLGAKLLEAGAATTTNPVARLQLELSLDILLARVRNRAKTSAVLAESAAIRIADDVRNLLLLEPSASNQLQKIHLIGHSRGAAVNARVSQLLSNAGYEVDQYTSLDGFSNDWPDDGSLLADIDIVNTTVANRRANYRVHNDLGDAIVNLLQDRVGREMQVLLDGFREYSAIARALPDPPALELSSPILERLRSLDLRAPVRGFEVEACLAARPGLPPDQAQRSDHLTVTEDYFRYWQKYPADQQHILDNYLGRNRFRGAEGVNEEPLAAGAFDATPCPSSPSGEGEEAREPLPGFEVHDFADGGFEQLGNRLSDLGAIPDLQDVEPFVRIWAEIARDPAFVLSSVWDVEGDVQIVSDASGYLAQLTQTENTSLGQYVLLDPTSDQLDFELTVIDAGPGDKLEIFVDDTAVQAIDLTMSGANGRHSVDISGYASQAARLTLRMTGPAAEPAVVRLDDLSVKQLQTPQATDDVATTQEDRAVAIDILANDTDDDGNLVPGTIRIADPPANGTISIDSSSGQVTYQPATDFVGTDSFRYSVFDNDGLASNEASVTIETSAVNDAPRTEPDRLRTDEGVPLVIAVLSNDVDVDGTVDAESVRIGRGTERGTLQQSEGGIITYTPASGFRGNDSFTYTVADDQGAVSEATEVSIEVRTNLAPIAVSEQLTVPQGTPSVLEPLANDLDPDGTLMPSGLNVVQGPANGTIIQHGNGTLTYTSSPDFLGSDRIRYTVADAEGVPSNVAELELSVVPAAPQIQLFHGTDELADGGLLEFAPSTQLSLPSRARIRIVNRGVTSLTWSEIKVSSDLFNVIPPRVSRLAPGAEAEFQVELSSERVQDGTTGTLTVVSDDPQKTNYTIQLRGDVQALPYLVYASDVVSFDADTSNVLSELEVADSTHLEHFTLVVRTEQQGCVCAQHLVLTRPDGASAQLFSRFAGDWQDPDWMVFTDLAQSRITTQTPGPHRGQFQPQEALSRLAGEDAQGSWSLNFANSGQTGRLQWWLLANPANQPPAIAPIPPATVVSGERLELQLSAADVEQDPLRFELVGDVPPGAVVDEASGRFSWKTAADQAPGDYPFFLSVTEAASESASFWADSVLDASSVYADSDRDILGAPNNAPWWPSVGGGSLEYITVGFRNALHANGATIIERDGYGAVYQVDVVDEGGQLHTVWSGVDTATAAAPQLTVSWPETEFAVQGLKVYLDTDLTTAWEGLEAIQIDGRPVSEPLNVIQPFSVAVRDRPRIISMSPNDGAAVTNLRQIELEFSEPMDRKSVQDENAYHLAGNGIAVPILSAVYDDSGDRYRVRLTLADHSGLSAGDYEVRVQAKNLLNADGVATAGGESDLLVHLNTEKRLARVDLTEPDVETAAEFGTVNAIYAVAGDFDDDGVVDRVSTSITTQEIVLFRGLPAGGFAEGERFPVSGAAQQLFSMDWNGDGRPDLVVPTEPDFSGVGKAGFDVLLSDPAEVFVAAPETPIPIPFRESAIYFGDLTGDGNIEIAQTGPSDANSNAPIEIIGKSRFLGYEVIQELSLGVGENFPISIDAADLNGDSRLDLVSGNAQPGPFVRNGSVTVFLATESGFSAAQQVEFDHVNAVQVLAADVNRDQHVDLIAYESRFSNFQGVSDGDVIHTLLGDGSGGFSAQPFQALGGRGATLVDAQDMNGDQVTDLLFTVTPWDGSHVELSDQFATWVWKGDGQGGFTPAGTPVATPELQAAPYGVFLFDLDNDSFLDAVIGDPVVGRVHSFVNDTSGALYALPDPIVTGFEPPASGAATVNADFNRDGFMDLALVTQSSFNESLEVLLGGPDGFKHSYSIPLPVQGASSWLDVGDMNGDGILDLVVDGAIFLGKGNGDFELGSTFTPPEANAEGLFAGRLFDVNRDGSLDLVVSLMDFFVDNLGVSHPTPVGAAVFFGDGEGNLFFNRNTIRQDYLSYQLVADDWTGDGIVDILWKGDSFEYETIALFPGLGNGTFGEVIESPVCPRSECSHTSRFDGFASLDFNHDGFQDIAWARDKDLLFLAGDGSGSFEPEPDLTVTISEERFAEIGAIIAEDFDGDSLIDLALSQKRRRFSIEFESVAVLWGRQDGTFETPSQVAVGGFPEGPLALRSIPRQPPVFVGGFRLEASLMTPQYDGPETIDLDNQVYSGSATPGAMVTLAKNNVELGSAVADVSGHWSLSTADALPVGFHRLTLSAVDSQGQASFETNFDVLVQQQAALRPWQNPNLPLDVNNDGLITPAGDILPMINELNGRVYIQFDGSLPLPPPSTPPPFYFDINGDDALTAVGDILIAINGLNRGVGEGETDSGHPSLVRQTLDGSHAPHRPHRSGQTPPPPASRTPLLSASSLTSVDDYYRAVADDERSASRHRRIFSTVSPDEELLQILAETLPSPPKSTGPLDA